MLAVKALKGAGWLVFSRFVGRIIDFFTLLVLARTLTPADFGLAALATSLVVVVDTMLEVPVTQALVRLPTIDKSHLDTGFTVGLLRGVLIGTIVLAAAWPYSWINRDSHLVLLVAVLALGPISRGLTSPAMINFARQLGFRQTFILESSGKLSASIIAMFVVLNGGAYWAIVANFVVASFASTVASYVLAPYRPAFSLVRLPDFAGFIGWFSSAQLISALNWQFDRFLIGALADRTTLGRYAVASDVAVIPTQSLIGPALQPVMAAFSQINADRARVRQAFLKATRFAMLISAPACVGISLTADLATDLLLGAKWEHAAPLLSLLALAVAPIPYFQTLSSVSVALDRPHVIFRLNAVDLCFRMLLITIGFYLGSVTGVSLARITLSTLMFAFYLSEARRLLEVSIVAQLRNLWKVAVAVTAMAIMVWFLRDELAGRNYPHVLELALVIALGAATYAATLLLLGVRLIAGRGRLELFDR
ncbi:oligosaccharide flippase family protein [Rhizobium binae]|uniref:oligosaccharide flippase family protein n=1 Tax=Rhizobium binae TaxID=1138190 RepID=UPI001C82EBC9|nr:oligosaccharide flippase family protein [Rhizobium binae]MBX4936534.1 oligosaccharide flippase family protein [Rhizobium binae]MBX4942858.1 oligosaccharide flippase family protein [Rhizobium binae]MBX4961740.1 oligosaccharide flippase family protein [Rhizobium binae]MBX4978465.1 oligosaccharide flippase family protein [Rhizobium binae]